MIIHEEQNKILIEWNNTNSEYPKDKTVHQLFEEQANKSPNNVSVIFENQRLTYRQLNEKANQLAHYLRDQGVVPDTLVAIAVERSPEMLIGLLGILKAGGAYVPLDPSYPQDRLNYMLENAQTTFLITQEQLLNKFKNYSGKYACLKYNHKTQNIGITDNSDLANWNASSNQNENNNRHLTKPNNLAYVIYTSGSTGKPKGVMVHHRNLTNFLVSISNRLKISPHDKLLSVTTLSFDIAALELLSPLINGASLLLTTRTISSDSNEFRKKIIEYDPTIVQATPSFWQILVDSPLNMYETNFKVLCGGEALSIDLAKKFIKYKGEFWNLYGPTETTIWSTIKHFHVASSLSSISIGKPIDNTQTYILDVRMDPVPIGTNGEIYIAGDGLARGYLNSPNTTAEKFVPNPFSSNSRLYRTGDLARYLPDGNIEFLGRIDDQVKIRGFRIEPGEIVSSLLAHEIVTQVAVTAREDGSGHKQLIAYVVPNGNTRKSLETQDMLVSYYQQAYHVLTGDSIPSLIEELRNYLKLSLPDHMIPSLFVFLDQIPLTSNGKVDKKSLSSSDFSCIRPKDKYTAPQTQTEKNLINIWLEVLKLEQISVHDNFFKIGGDSIISFQIIYRAQQQGIFFSVEDVFNYPTIAELASISNTKENALNVKHEPILGQGEFYSTKNKNIPLERINLIMGESNG